LEKVPHFFILIERLFVVKRIGFKRVLFIGIQSIEHLKEHLANIIRGYAQSKHKKSTLSVHIQKALTALTRLISVDVGEVYFADCSICIDTKLGEANARQCLYITLRDVVYLLGKMLYLIAEEVHDISNGENEEIRFEYPSKALDSNREYIEMHQGQVRIHDKYAIIIFFQHKLIGVMIK
jgi:hypothetical protein